jgi:hypothetical protein
MSKTWFLSVIIIILAYQQLAWPEARKRAIGRDMLSVAMVGTFYLGNVFNFLRFVDRWHCELFTESIERTHKAHISGIEQIMITL